jgi:hypothetical protein
LKETQKTSRFFIIIKRSSNIWRNSENKKMKISNCKRKPRFEEQQSKND